MIPILYESTENEFKSNGLGKLSDAIDAVVTEERNGVFELTMTYPVSGIHYSDINVNRIILVKPSWAQDPQPFDIKSITPSTDGMTAEIYAQHISYRLSDIPIRPFTATGINLALEGLKNNAMIPNDFETWTDLTNNETKFSVKFPKSFRACLGGTEGSILDTFAGSASMDFMWDFKTVRIYKNRGIDQGVTIRYGKNLTSLKQEINIEDVYTGVVACWQDSQNGESVYGDILYIQNHKDFPREKIFIYDASSEFESTDENNKPTQAQLTQSAKKYLDRNPDLGVPKVNLDVSFVDLSQTAEYENIAPLERVNLCDKVTVYFPAFNVNAKARVIKTKWNVLKDAYDSIELGDAKSQFGDTIKQQAHDAVDQTIKDTRSFMQKALDHAADLIKGGESGHMVIGTNADGESNELFFMDTDNKATAKNVLRLNMNGIAFSQSGINGPFNSAWTIDSRFVADFITTGTLRAGLIKAGILSDAKGTNFWNMETGEFRLQSVNSIADYADEKQSINDYAEEQAKLAREAAEKKAQDLADNASSLAKAAQAEADKKIVTFYQTNEPSGASSGDLWIDTDDGNSLHRWNGKQWTNVQDKKMQTALTAANDAQSTADGKIVTYSQKTAPSSKGLTVGDLWFNPDDNNHLKRWNGSSWVESRDGYIDVAADKARQDAEKKVTDLDNSLNQTSIFNRLTNNGKIKGIYMSDGSLFINADYIKSGTMSADLIRGGTFVCGGDNNKDGLFIVRNAYGIDLVNIDCDGISVSSLYYTNKYTTKINDHGLRVEGDGYGNLRTAFFDSNNYKSVLLTINSDNDGLYFADMNAGAFQVTHKMNSSGSVETIFHGGVRGLICKGTKSRIVDTEDYGNRLLYCYETPSPMFGDIGEGVIGDDGQAYIQIDPTFAETINTLQYQVFLQKYGKGDCYISERNSTYFIVKGDPGLSFGWEIKAKQNDFDQMRLETFYNDEPEGDSTNYGVTASEHIKELNEGRLLS